METAAKFLHFLLLLSCCSAAPSNRRSGFMEPQVLPEYSGSPELSRQPDSLELSGFPEHQGSATFPECSGQRESSGTQPVIDYFDVEVERNVLIVNLITILPQLYDLSEDHPGQTDNSSRYKAAERIRVKEMVKQFLKGSLMTRVIPSMYIIVFIISIPLNAATIFIFSLMVKTKKPAAIYMLNLAMADLLFVLLLPFKASYHYNGNDWIYGSTMCRVVTFAFYCNMYCTVLLITCISADRFLAVVYPIRSLTWRSWRSAVVVCCTTWLLAVAGMMPILLSEQTVHLEALNITTCHDVKVSQQEHAYYSYFFPTVVNLFFFIPLIITTACYLSILRALRSSRESKRSRKTRAMVMAATVLTVFVVCFTPSNILLLVHYADEQNENKYMAYLVSVSIGSMNCCLDPVIYYFGSSQCRKQVTRLLSCGAPQESSKPTSSGTSDQQAVKGTLNS